MKVVECVCGARSTSGGDCIVCGASLGSIPQAIAAAAVAIVVLTIAWLVVVLAIGAVAMWFPVLYGGCVSGAVVQHSFGRGWRFQLIASVATVVGLAISYTVLYLLLAGRLDLLLGVPSDLEQGWTRPFEVALVLAERDPLMFMVCALGVLGGGWVWRQPEGDEP